MREIKAGDYSAEPLAQIKNPDGTVLCIIRQPKEADIWAFENEAKEMQKRAKKWGAELKKRAEAARKKAEEKGEVPEIDEAIDDAPVPRNLSTSYLIAARVAVLSEPRVSPEDLLDKVPLGILNELNAEAVRIAQGSEPKKDPSGT